MNGGTQCGRAGGPLGVTLTLCLVQMLALSGSLTFQTLIPQFVEAWGLSNTEAGWIASVTYVAYAGFAPILVAMTDRIDARRIVAASLALSVLAAFGFALFAEGFWSALVWRLLSGIGVAGSYMPGLKALTDRVEGARQGRYQSFYTATFSLGSGLSMLQAGIFADLFGLNGAFLASGLVALLGLPLVWFGIAARNPPAQTIRQPHLRSFAEVLRHRPTLPFIVAYAGHSWELFAFRTWLVAFLTALPAMSLSTGAIATIATVMVMAGLPASILGNEIATRLGRRFTLAAMMTASAATALLLAFTSGGPLPLVLALTSLYAVLVMSDSAAITVGTIASAPVERRGATIAVQTLMASLMAMIAPLACGWSLDLFGGESRWGWGIALAIMGGGALFGALGVARVGGRREKA